MAEQRARESNENSEHRSGFYDTEPIEAPREDVEMEDDEGEEPLEAEAPKSKNESQESHESRNKNTKIQDMLCAEVGVVLVSKVEELVDNIELNCWRKSKEKGRLGS